MIEKFIKFSQELEDSYRRSFASSIKRENSEIDDFFMLICFSEIFGLENPYSLYTLEMLPVLMPKFHDWHQNLGIKHSFFENFPCTCC